LIVREDVPELFATDAGANVQVGAGVPPPVTAQVKATVPVKPAVGAMVMVAVAEAPAATAAGVAAPGTSVKSGVGAALTARLTELAWVNDPEVPVTVKFDVAIGVEVRVVMVRVDVPVVTEAGLNEQVAPAGRPLHVSATVPLKPLVGVTVTVEVPDCPGPTTLTGVPPTAKSGVVTKPGHALINAFAFTDPSPVTRS